MGWKHQPAGGSADPPALVVLDKLVGVDTPTAHGNSIAEGDVFRLVVPAGLVAVDDYLRLYAWGDLQNFESPGGVTVNFDWRFYADDAIAGENNLYRRIAVSNDSASTGQRRYWTLEMELHVDTVSFLRGGSKFWSSGANKAADNDVWKQQAAIAEVPGVGRIFLDGTTLDVTAGFDLALTLQMDRAHALIEARCWGASVLRYR